MLLAYYGAVDALKTGIEGLSKYRQERLSAAKVQIKKQQGIGAELLLYKALEKAVPGMALPPEISVNEYGKPYLEKSDVFFSLSHSGKLAFCAVSGHELGADVQQAGSYDSRLAKRFFTAGEIKYIESCPDMDMAFARVWALKESYIKAVGMGLGMPLNSFDICPEGECLSEIMEYSFWHHEAEGCVFAICVKNGAAKPDEFIELRL